MREAEKRGGLGEDRDGAVVAERDSSKNHLEGEALGRSSRGCFGGRVGRGESGSQNPRKQMRNEVKEGRGVREQQSPGTKDCCRI